MTTVGELIKLLSDYPAHFEITDEQNSPFIHIVNMCGDKVILSTVKPIGLCDRSGEYVYPSVVDGYTAFSPALDEDLFEIEFTRDLSSTKEE
jgi:hypothetical protein